MDADKVARLAAEPPYMEGHAGRLYPVGLEEIAALLQVKRDTVDKWRHRGLLPKPTWPSVGGRPAWATGVIEDWAKDTGRWPASPLRKPLLDCPDGANERTRLMFSLAGVVAERLRDGGWVSLAALLELAPEGRIVRVPELEAEEPFAADYAHGGAYDAGPSGSPDGGMLESAIRIARDRAERDGGTLEEGYPAGMGRSFRLVT